MFPLTEVNEMLIDNDAAEDVIEGESNCWGGGIFDVWTSDVIGEVEEGGQFVLHILC